MISKTKSVEVYNYVKEHGHKKAMEEYGVSSDTIYRYCRRRKEEVRPWLLFGDLHAPYHHKRALEFLSHVHKKYDCRNHVYCVGDLYDFHSMSRHTTELDSTSPDVEYHKATQFVGELAELFPLGTLTIGNHDAIPQRQLKEICVSTALLKEVNELYNLPSTWKVEHLYATIPEIDVLIEHGIGSNGVNGAINSAIAKQCSYIQGHMHAFPGTAYRASHFALRWAMNTGCLADNTSLAMRYGRYSKNKGVLGCGLVYPASGIIGEHAVFIPMNPTKES